MAVLTKEPRSLRYHIPRAISIRLVYWQFWVGPDLKRLGTRFVQIVYSAGNLYVWFKYDLGQKYQAPKFNATGSNS